jgi:hypothetical protein
MLMVRGLSLSARGMKSAVGIDLDWHGQGSIEGPRQPLAPMQADLLGIGEVLLAGNADRVVLGLDLKVGFVDACQLDDCDQIVALLEDIDGREGPSGGGCPPQPIAFQTRLQGPLKIQ